MKIKIKYNNKFIEVYVRDEKCKKKDCLVPHHWQHRGATLSGSKDSGIDPNFSCATRNYRGCPDN